MDHLARLALGEFATGIEQGLADVKGFRNHLLEDLGGQDDEALALAASLLQQKQETNPLPHNATPIDRICYFAEAMFQVKRTQPEPKAKNTPEYAIWLASNYGSKELCGLMMITQMVMLGAPLSKLVKTPADFLELFAKSFDYIERHPKLYRQWNSVGDISNAVADPGNFIVGVLRVATAEGCCPPMIYEIVNSHADAVCGALKKQVVYTDEHIRIYGGKGRDLTVDVRTVHNTWNHFPLPGNRPVPLSSWKRARKACLNYKGEPLVGELSHEQSAHVCQILGIRIEGNLGILGFSTPKKRVKAKGFG